MKYPGITVIALAILLFILTACSNAATPDDDTVSPHTPSLPANAGLITPPANPTTPPNPEPTPDLPAASPVSEENITVSETPVALASRPEFRPEDRVREEELISLHGYSIGMTFAQTQQVWEIPKDMIDYAIGRWTPENASLAIFVGNMYYGFKPGTNAVVENFDDYILKEIYYGETIFCTNREPLCVLRDIKLGDTIADALKSLPGNRTPRRWATDQLYGKYVEPNSASLEYTTNLGFYELRIYCENSCIRLLFGSSGKLWIAEASPI